MRKSDLLGASAIALLCAVPAFAQDAPPTTQAQGAPAATSAAPQIDRSATDTDDIIVTATKREQTLQDVPVSVAVTSDDTIK